MHYDPFADEVLDDPHPVYRRLREEAPLLPSDNRDESEFANPDRFDIHRRPERIRSFGHGIHRMGVHFAKLEGRVLPEEPLRALPDYSVDEATIHRERTEFVRGFRVLPIEFDTIH